MFKLPKRRLYTWKSSAVTKEHVIRNQIDYILITTDIETQFNQLKHTRSRRYFRSQPTIRKIKS